MEVVAKDVTGQAMPEMPAQKVDKPQEPEVKKEETKEQDDFKMMQLLRREKAIRAEKRKLEEERASFMKEMESLKNKPAQPQTNWKDLYKNDPYGLLRELGVSQDEFTQLMLTQDPNNYALTELKKELMASRQELDAIKKQLEESPIKAKEQALEQIKRDAKRIVQSNPEAYELISLNGDSPYETVKQIIDAEYNDSGDVLDVEEVLDAIEEMYLEQSLALTSSKKVKAKLTPSQEAANAETGQSPVQGTQSPKATSLSHSTVAGSKPMSARERAILAFNKKL